MNYHGAPYRQVRWGTGVTRSVHIRVSRREERLLGLTAIASEDPPARSLGQPAKKRRIKSEILAQDLTGEELLARLPQLLEQAREVAESWTEADLQ